MPSSIVRSIGRCSVRDLALTVGALPRTDVHYFASRKDAVSARMLSIDASGTDISFTTKGARTERCRVSIEPKLKDPGEGRQRLIEMMYEAIEGLGLVRSLTVLLDDVELTWTSAVETPGQRLGIPRRVLMGPDRPHPLHVPFPPLLRLPALFYLPSPPHLPLLPPPMVPALRPLLRSHRPLRRSPVHPGTSIEEVPRRRGNGVEVVGIRHGRRRPGDPAFREGREEGSAEAGEGDGREEGQALTPLYGRLRRSHCALYIWPRCVLEGSSCIIATRIRMASYRGASELIDGSSERSRSRRRSVLNTDDAFGPPCSMSCSLHSKYCCGTFLGR